MSENTITLKLNESDASRLYQAFAESAVKSPPQYALWQLRPENCVITMYSSGKCVFQGKDAAVYASPFRNEADIIFPQAGSDEVGTGDYFGPVCVCACIVREEDTSLLADLDVKDSKMITDETIRKSGPQLAARLPHSLLILPPSRYNEVHQTNNMNEIKAKMHNQAYLNLAKKQALPPLRIIDQFTPEQTYYRYLAGEKEIIGRIRFETKAENKYLCVACASIIARYAFLVSMDKMEAEYGMEFVKGASGAVDECARMFVKRFGKEKLGSVAKLHFKNTERL